MVAIANDFSFGDYYPQLTSPKYDGNNVDGPRASGILLYAPYDIEIIQPQAGLDTKNRYYKQYTGLEYNVKVAVRGGDFSALVYSLTTAPSGMTIDASTGVITWANPIESGSPHDIAVSVTDGLTVDSTAWTLTVDTTNALFLDSVSGDSANDGTIGSPMEDWVDFYEALEADDSYRDYFVYYRAGTYFPNGNANNANNGNQWGPQKPLVHMAYPGETVVQDFSLSYFFYDAIGHNTYIDDFDIINTAAYAVSAGEWIFCWRLGGNNIVFRRCSWRDIPDFAGSFNQSYIMAVSSGGTGNRNNWLVSENDFDGNDANAYASMVAYDTDNLVFESNLIASAGNKGVGIKTRNDTTSIRGNYITGTNDLIWLYQEFGTGGSHEVSWNFADASANYGYNYNDAFTEPAGDVYVIRNTLLQSTFYQRLTSNMGINYEVHNVVVSTDTNNIAGGTLDDLTRVVQTDNLVNTVETNFVDPVTGLLIDSYVGQNATRGHNGLAGLK